jgi:hypothetical protein
MSDITLFKTTDNDVHGETRDLYWRVIPKWRIDETVSPPTTELLLCSFLSSQLAAGCACKNAVDSKYYPFEADGAFLEDLEKYNSKILDFVATITDENDPLYGAVAYPVDENGNPT